MTKAAFTQADLSRALKAARDAGLAVCEVVLEGRRARIVTATQAPAKASADTLKPKEWDAE